MLLQLLTDLLAVLPTVAVYATVLTVYAFVVLAVFRWRDK